MLMNDMASDRQATVLPPHDIEAEEALLASLMVEPQLVWQIAPILTPGAFFRERNAWIYSAIIALAKRDELPTQLAVASELAQQAKLEAVGGLTYLNQLITRLPTTVGADFYAREVRRTAYLRELAQVGLRLQQHALRGRDDPDALAAEVMGQLAGLAAAQHRHATLRDLLCAWFDEPEATAGARLQMPGLDQYLPTLSPGDVLVVAAYTSVGKTAFALQIARNVAYSGRTVAIASAEMSVRDIALRMLALESRVAMERLRHGLDGLSEAEGERVNRAAGRLADAAVEVLDAAGWTADDVLLAARRVQAQRGLGFLVIDYVQILAQQDKRDTPTEAVARSMRAIKAMAGALKVPVVAVAQLRRRNDDRRPGLQDLLQSGAIERDADAVVLLHWTNKEKREVRPIELLVEKNRNGRTGLANIEFVAAHGLFIERRT